MSRICNRSACRHVRQTGEDFWWNSSTRAWYCEACARQINKCNVVGLCVPERDLPPMSDDPIKLAAVTRERDELIAKYGEAADKYAVLAEKYCNALALNIPCPHCGHGGGGKSKCGHNPYWITHFGNCMACQRAEANKRAEQAEAKVAALKEVLALCDGDGKRAQINAAEDRTIEMLCDDIGYGAVMDAAARLWFRKDPVGALTVGPCAMTVRKAMVTP